MALKSCPGCNRIKTHRNSAFIGRLDGLWYFNCSSCGSTFVVRAYRALIALALAFLVNCAPDPKDNTPAVTCGPNFNLATLQYPDGSIKKSKVEECSNGCAFISAVDGSQTFYDCGP